MTDKDRIRAAEEPRSEPEIILPHAGARPRDAMRISVDERGIRRSYVTRLGPFGVIVLALAIGFVAALLLVLLVGALLLWIPIVAILMTIATVSALMRPSFQRWR
jgi:uncharacterized membrane protein YoaK (UPF0700 family)